MHTTQKSNQNTKENTSTLNSSYVHQLLNVTKSTATQATEPGQPWTRAQFFKMKRTVATSVRKFDRITKNKNASQAQQKGDKSSQTVSTNVQLMRTLSRATAIGVQRSLLQATGEMTSFTRFPLEVSPQCSGQNTSLISSSVSQSPSSSCIASTSAAIDVTTPSSDANDNSAKVDDDVVVVDDTSAKLHDSSSSLCELQITLNKNDKVNTDDSKDCDKDADHEGSNPTIVVVSGDKVNKQHQSVDCDLVQTATADISANNSDQQYVDTAASTWQQSSSDDHFSSSPSQQEKSDENKTKQTKIVLSLEFDQDSNKYHQLPIKQANLELFDRSVVRRQRAASTVNLLTDKLDTQSKQLEI